MKEEFKHLNLNWTNSDITVEQRAQLQALVEEYSDIFAKHEFDLGKFPDVVFNINTGTHPPHKMKPYRIPFKKRQLMSDIVQKLLQADVIERSESPWCTAALLVDKKGAPASRLVCDYRPLNKKIPDDQYPLGNIQDLFETIGPSRYYSSLDLAQGYHQIDIAPEDRPKTAFQTHDGLFQYKKLPFGLKSAPSAFSRAIQSVLRPVLWKCAVCYLDDICVFSKTFEEHVAHLRQVFELIRKAGVKLKAKKCELAKHKIIFLGHVLSENGISADPAKIDKLRNIPAPNTLRKLRALIGYSSYYRALLPNYSQRLAPMLALLKKDVPYVWTENCQKSFEWVRDYLTSDNVIAHADYSSDFILHMDASFLGMGAVLSQIQNGLERPIYFISRTLKPSEARYSTIEIEAACVIWAVAKLRCFLYGSKFTIFTDHSPLQHLLKRDYHDNPRLCKYQLKLQGYNVEIRYKPGKKNMVADFLSRLPTLEKAQENDKASTSTALGICRTFSDISSKSFGGLPEFRRNPKGRA